MRVAALLIGCLSLGGCATVEHGMVTGYHGDEAEIGLGAADGLKAGSRINFLEDRCGNDVQTLGEQWKCKRVTDGTGIVASIVDDHRAVVKLDDGTHVRWTQRVELNTEEGSH